jgi:hypothetical protein
MFNGRQIDSSQRRHQRFLSLSLSRSLSFSPLSATRAVLNLIPRRLPRRSLLMSIKQTCRSRRPHLHFHDRPRGIHSPSSVKEARRSTSVQKREETRQRQREREREKERERDPPKIERCELCKCTSLHVCIGCSKSPHPP